MEVYLETERLVLRWLTAADLDHLVELDSDPEVMRFLSGGTPTPRDVIEREILPRFLSYNGQANGYGYFAAIDKATGNFLGWFSFRPHEESAPGEVELGYRLHQGRLGPGVCH